MNGAFRHSRFNSKSTSALAGTGSTWDQFVKVRLVCLFCLSEAFIHFLCCRVEWLILDEADKLFEEGKDGFRDQVYTLGQYDIMLVCGGTWCLCHVQ